MSCSGPEQPPPPPPLPHVAGGRARLASKCHSPSDLRACSLSHEFVAWKMSVCGSGPPTEPDLAMLQWQAMCIGSRPSPSSPASPAAHAAPPGPSRRGGIPPSAAARRGAPPAASRSESRVLCHARERGPRACGSKPDRLPSAHLRGHASAAAERASSLRRHSARHASKARRSTSFRPRPKRSFSASSRVEPHTRCHASSSPAASFSGSLPSSGGAGRTAAHVTRGGSASANRRSHEAETSPPAFASSSTSGADSHDLRPAPAAASRLDPPLCVHPRRGPALPTRGGASTRAVCSVLSFGRCASSSSRCSAFHRSPFRKSNTQKRSMRSATWSQ
mmetsp:Transcript_523/g.1721  ORF Transcript_523/g.1721 Transcript_523/m.1721 type:complete len:334 (+) Transcript_523:1162-2163(+)